MRLLRSIAIAVSAGLLASAAAATDFGPEPDWGEARIVTEAALKAKMIDPASTRISWPYGFTQGFVNHLFDEPHYGWWTCGRINSRGWSGDYVGDIWFVVLIKDGVIQSLDRGNSLEVTHASALCEDAVGTGKLRPAPIPVIAAAPEATAAPAAPAPSGEKIGIGFVPTAAGAVIQLVVPGSPAARAGLKVGQVIAAVNGMPLRGLAAAEMIKAVRAETPAVFYSLVDGGDVKVVRRAS
jgi:hypothetical protein